MATFGMVPHIITAAALGATPSKDKRDDVGESKLPLKNGSKIEKTPQQIIEEAVLGNKTVNRCVAKRLQITPHTRGEISATVTVKVGYDKNNNKKETVSVSHYQSVDTKVNRNIRDKELKRCITNRIKSSVYQFKKPGTYTGDVVIDIDRDPEEIIKKTLRRIDTRGNPIGQCFSRGRVRGTFKQKEVTLAGVIKVNSGQYHGRIDPKSVRIKDLDEVHFTDSDLICFAEAAAEIYFPNLYNKDLSKSLFKFEYVFHELPVIRSEGP